MLFVKNIDVGKGTGNLVCKEHDCYQENANLNYALTYGNKTEIEEFIAPKLKNKHFNLSVNNYVRNHSFFSDVWVNDKKLKPHEYTISTEGFLTLENFVYKNAKVVVQYNHDFDKQKGIVVHSWTLTQGEGVYVHTLGTEEKFMVPKWEPNATFSAFLKPTGCNFPIKMTKDRSYIITDENNALWVKLGKQFSYSSGDTVILTRAIPDFYAMLPIEKHKEVWQAKRR